MGLAAQEMGNQARETHVQNQMGRQGKLIEHLSKAVGALESRLSSVLRDVPPNATGAKAEIAPMLVGHANAIRNQNDQLAQLVDTLESICDRLEL